MIPEIRLETPVDPSRAARLHENLAAAGQTLREDALKPFLFHVSDAADTLLAGCKGEIAFRSARVSELWVDPALRGQGLGHALLEAAEAHARKHDCTRIHIETRNEKARALYERLGYRVFGKLPNYEGTNAFYYLEKPLG